MSKEKKFYETADFLKEKKKWDKKLKDSGFDDIAISDWSEYRINPQIIELDMEKVNYHQRCLEVLARDQFKDEIDRFIFREHCEGNSFRKISELLPLSGLKCLKKDMIHRRLLKILKDNNIEPVTFNS